VATALKDTLSSDKSPDEIGHKVAIASFKAVVMGAIIATLGERYNVVTNGLADITLADIPGMTVRMAVCGIAGCWFASGVSQWHGRIAYGFATICRRTQKWFRNFRHSDK
jgi:hypothetical protein